MVNLTAAIAQMFVCLVHNAYGRLSGEEVVVDSVRELLIAHGHRVTEYRRSSAELNGHAIGKAKAFFSGIYNPLAGIALRQKLDICRPDVVHVHNLYPLISPSVLVECRRAGLPVVMTVHNYRLICPNGLHMVHDEVCDECADGHEYRCVSKRCEGSFFKSLGYALRNAIARKLHLFRDNVTIYAALTEFQRRRLVAAGYPAERIAVVPNMVNGIAAPAQELGDWVGYVGRVSPEKDIPTLMGVAANEADVPFKAAGAYERMPQLLDEAPRNFEFLGHLHQEELRRFYRNSRIIVLCSTWYEGFPTILAQAMLHGKPIVCSRIGGLPEIVDDGVTGLLFEPGNAEDLASKIRYLWDRPDLCRQMGQAGREKALREYSPEKYYERLMAAYRTAIELGPGGPGRNGRRIRVPQDASCR